MIEFLEINKSKPYKRLAQLYELAVSNNQSNIEAISISSFSKTNNEVESRFVNLKYIKGNEWIFFTNYESNKCIQLGEHNQISALFYWDSINVQIRLKAKIYKTDPVFSDTHYQKRGLEKNALAHSSNQSRVISSYERVNKKYHEQILLPNKLIKRPDYWGGISFEPYFFEFWEGHESRINKRDVFINTNSKWDNFVLEP
jgi:pyridoxamine 5'-phosphate oxidase